MTREEMIDALEELKTKNLVEGSEDSERIDYVLNNTLDSLEMWKLPVKDAISREKVLEIIKDTYPLDCIAAVCIKKIIHLPSVYPKAKVGDDVLNKIRAEIEERAGINQCLNVDRAKALCWCLEIIDKYKAESEDK